jgi:uncharacterized phiE125 gp8 family phage protein
MSNWYLKSGYGTSKNDNYQYIKTELVTAPTLTIVTKTEAKNYLKLGTDTTDDTLIEDLIKACQIKIEQELGGVSLVTQTWKQTQKGGCKNIKLSRQPVIGVPTVSYYEEFDTVTATNITYSSYFRVVQPNELHHIDGYFEEGRDGDGYSITYQTGMFTASNYTNSSDQRLYVFKDALLRMVAYLYDNRQDYVTSVNEGAWSVSFAKDGLPFSVKELLMPYHTGNGLI